MKKASKDKHFIKKPSYEGGLSALRTFIKANLKYPKTAKSNKIEGTVFLKYTINYKGEVIGAKILKSLGYGCDEEAIRLVKLLKFKVEKTRKIKIQFHKNIQIHFKLPKQEDTKIQYNYTTTNKSKPQEDGFSDSGYTYSIDIN